MKVMKEHNGIKVGDRIEVIDAPKDPTIKPGMTGTISQIQQGYGEIQYWVDFDSGSRLALLDGIDTFKIIKQ